MNNNRRILFDGKLNYWDGLSFYYSRHDHVISFFIQEIGDRRRTIIVRMEPDINHGRAHVHIDKHNASFAIDSGELMEGQCDAHTQRTIQSWILRHRVALLELWDVVKCGKNYQPYVKKIQEDLVFTDFGFKGEEPENLLTVDGAKIWYEGDIFQKTGADNVNNIISEGDMFVGVLKDFREESFSFRSINGSVQKKHKK